MAVLVMVESPGVTTELYDAVNDTMDVEATPPEGLICHTAAVVNGSLRVVDVWESRDAYERFSKERLGPAIQAVSGGQEPPAPPIESIHELHKVLKT